MIKIRLTEIKKRQVTASTLSTENTEMTTQYEK